MRGSCSEGVHAGGQQPVAFALGFACWNGLGGGENWSKVCVGGGAVEGREVAAEKVCKQEDSSLSRLRCSSC